MADASATSNGTLLEVVVLKKHFPIQRGFFRVTVGHIKAVDGVSPTIKEGETLGLVGESGCGKTTLGRCIVRLYEPTAGSVVFHDKGQPVNVSELEGKELRALRRNMQIVFQDPYASLNPRMTVLQIVGEPLIIHGISSGKELQDRVEEMLGFVGLQREHLRRYSHSFSGGQRQRIGIARALVLRPKLVVADEPVSALDVSIQAQTLNLLKRMQDELQLTYLFVSHDLGVVRYVSDRIAVMYVGKLVELSGKDEVLRTPLTPEPVRPCAGRAFPRHWAMRATSDRPNVILVNCDDLGYGDLGCYGSAVHDTPHLDRMAAEGMRFTDFYQAAPICSPSRGAMLTGCYPRRIGFDCFDGNWVLFPGQAVGLDPRETTFASLLRGRGYATQMVGKWHCGDQPEFLPTRHGFDHYYGLPYSNDMGRQVGNEKWPPLPLLRDEEPVELQPDQSSLTERYLEEAVRFMRSSSDRPFLLYFAHMYVHLPLYVPDRFLRESRGGKYGAAVACIDWVMGVLLHEVRRLGLADRTLVLFTSDNGSRCDYGRSNGQLRGTKGTTWEGGMRLPLIAWWPGRIRGGATCREVVSGMDLLPTLARTAGAETPTDRIIDGRDVSPLLFSETGAASPHAELFYYYGSYLDAVRAGNWKLFTGRHQWSGGESDLVELYDLESDPGESTNVAASHPEVVRDLEARLEVCRRDLGDATVGAPGSGCRPIGRVANPRPLADFDASHPYYIAMYDLNEMG